MPFEPRIAGGPDEALQAARTAVCDESQHDLPADLAELARQLMDDAEQIDVCQAPGERPVLPPPPERNWRRPAWAATAAAALVAVGVALWYAAGGGNVNTSRTGSVAANSPAEPQPVAEMRAADPGPPPVTSIALPASVFSQLSGAEQDGMSDLLEGVPCRVELP